MGQGGWGHPARRCHHRIGQLAADSGPSLYAHASAEVARLDLSPADRILAALFLDARQQQALLAVLDRQPVSVLRREAQRLAALNLFLPDNQLLLHFIEQTGETALYLKLWRQPVDHDSLTALHTISRFYSGQEASDLLIAASRNGRLMIPALQQLSRLSPLPDGAQQYLLAELGKHQYGGLVAGLLLQMDEPRLLGQLADRLTRQERRHASSVMLPDTGTPDARPGL